MANNKGIFHFYKINSDKDISNFFEIIYEKLSSEWYLPDNKDANRYKVHDIQKIEKPIKIIFWNFYKYYEEEIKTIENSWDTAQNAEYYPFLLIVDHGVFLLQHKAWYWNKHAIKTVVNDFIGYMSNSLKAIGIPWWIHKMEIKRDQKDLVKFFFNKKNTIKRVEAEEFSFRKFEENKYLNIYTYFNPRASEEDAVTQTENYFINHTKKISVEWNQDKSLAKVPPVRIAVASAEHIKVIEGEDEDEKYFCYTPQTRKVEYAVSEKINNREVLMVALEFLKYFDWDINSIEIKNNIEDDFIDKWIFWWIL